MTSEITVPIDSRYPAARPHAESARPRGFVARLRVAKAALSLLILWAALLLPVGAGAFYLYQKHQQLDAALHDLAPRYARLAGLQQHAELIHQLAQSAQMALEQRMYVATEASAVANDALQRARAALEESGLSIEASQAGVPQDDGALQRVGLNLTVEGDIAAIVAGLQKLQASRPAIRVLKLSIRPAGLTPPSSNPRLKLQLVLAVWRQATP